MGKPTGFMEFDREPAHVRPPLERIKDWSETHPGYEEKTLREQGARCMDCGIALLPHRRARQRPGDGLPDPQPHPGVERPGLSRPVARGDHPAPEDQQLPRVHRPRLPGAVRRLLHPRHQPAGGDDQDHRERDHRARLPRRLGRSRAASGPDRHEGRGRRQRPVRPRRRGPAQPAGHEVTVYERDDRIGGLLVYGIPT
jgi:glutamate synthase (NADPH/NADH) small chain